MAKLVSTRRPEPEEKPAASGDAESVPVVVTVFGILLLVALATGAVFVLAATFRLRGP